jgi:peptidoglycan/xylan/chitin deacetylase (PgdA/CDA1 family)
MTLRGLTPSVRMRARRAVDALVGTRLGSIRSVRTDQPLVALTFDDGPDDEWTPRVLDILAERQAHATFFMLVQNARRMPDLVRRVVADGHEVGLHGFDHQSLAGRSRRSTRYLLGSAATELETIADAPVDYFRPPYGDQTVASFLGTRDAGLECVVWDLDSLDWQGGEERRTAAEVVSRAAPGNIVLLHDGVAGDARRCANRGKTVELVVDGLQRRELRSATLSDLLAVGTAHHTAWFSLRASVSERSVRSKKEVLES